MSNDEPTLDDVMAPTETVHPDHREHAKSPKHLDSEELDERAEHEHELVENAEKDF
ncbi:hypothetical protein LH935_28460 (plasmid) [Gordonia polyisoprenivorans]|uniref:hypothetical protein n=1 Tax=Gordonia polyisoprenivorans TaxID=84595 RepID=UPI00223496A9|nr:hypothetical protein LH935_28460 [Gordonia polyisoprenivorans]